MRLLDSNLFIEAKNTYYRFDIAPGFWDWIHAAHANGMVASIPAVRDELQAQNDDLAAWARTLPHTFWLPETTDTVASMQALAHWAMTTTRPYTAGARAEFLNSADYRLIAAAHAGTHIVVTREQSSPNAKNRIRIPDACVDNHVATESPFDLYAAGGLKLT